MFNDRQVSLDVTPAFPFRHTSLVEAQVYVAALEDARAKAQVLAARLGTHLGATQSVAETARSNGDFYASAAGSPLKGVEMARSVTADPTGLVTLAVTFVSNAGPIAVYGSHAGVPVRPALRDATGISISLGARGDTIGDAAKRLRSVDAVVRRLARQYGAADSAIVVQQSGIRSF